MRTLKIAVGITLILVALVFFGMQLDFVLDQPQTKEVVYSLPDELHNTIVAAEETDITLTLLDASTRLNPNAPHVLEFFANTEQFFY